MTIVSVGKMWSRDGGSASYFDRRTTQTIREGWQVVSSADATIEEVQFATGLPRIKDLYAGTNWIFCRTVTPQRVGPIYWMVDVEYSGEIGPSGVDDSPINNLPEIEWGDVEAEEAVDQDDYGYPITNAIGDPVDGITARIADQTVTIRRNYLIFSPYLTRLYRRSVNSDYFLDWPPGTAKLVRFNARNVLDTTFGYWEVTATIQFREPFNTVAAHAWWKRYRNEGLYCRSPGSLIARVNGGGGSGTVLSPVVDRDTGGISAIAIISRGYGYSSAPSVFVESTISGSGATATATLNAAGEVSAITVTSPGSDYPRKIIRTVDDNKEPSTRPQLLAADGTQLFNTEEAVWIERPIGVTPLPYNSLGLL